MAIAAQAFDERFALYLDFLGIREAIRHWPASKLHKFVDLLRTLVQLRAEEDIQGRAMEDGGYQISLQPATSTFSDHIVVSYPAPPDYAGLDTDGRARLIWDETICQDCIRIISAVAELALRQGLLLRGAISVGDLFHADEVVFGEALVDAYEMEFNIAKFPRVVASERVLTRFKGGPQSYPHLFVQDTSDGIWHLNYFPRMREHGAGMGKPDSIQRWNEAMKIIIADNLTALKDQEKPFKYWQWFEAQMRPILEP